VNDATAPPAVAPGPVVRERGFGQHLAGLLFSPREEFASILARPRFWVPLACWMALGIAFTAVWMQKVEPREFLRNQIQLSGRADKMDPGQLERVLDAQARFFKPFGWVSVAVAPPLITFLIALVFLFVFRFFYAGEVRLAQSLAVVAWTFFVVALVTTPLVLVVMSLKGEWNLSPQEAVQANAGMFLDRQTTARPLYSLASSLDLFSFWTMWLLASGYGVATRRTTAAAAAGVVGVWALYVLVKVALAAVF